ncbi:hypothetical protein [Aurantivibrio plasticivorans]
MSSVQQPLVSADLPLQAVRQWFSEQVFEPLDVDCVTTIKLKILDGKCKMTEEDKWVIGLLYEVTKGIPGKLFDEDMYALIEEACAVMAGSWEAEQHEQLRINIYEKRLLAETMISRPVMKAFKKMIRENGVYSTALSSK